MNVTSIVENGAVAAFTGNLLLSFALLALFVLVPPVAVLVEAFV